MRAALVFMAMGRAMLHPKRLQFGFCPDPRAPRREADHAAVEGAFLREAGLLSRRAARGAGSARSAGRGRGASRWCRPRGARAGRAAPAGRGGVGSSASRAPGEGGVRVAERVSLAGEQVEIARPGRGDGPGEPVGMGGARWALMADCTPPQAPKSSGLRRNTSSPMKPPSEQPSSEVRAASSNAGASARARGRTTSASQRA